MKTIIQLLVLLVCTTSFAQIITVNEKRKPNLVSTPQTVQIVNLNDTTNINPQYGLQINPDKKTATIIDKNKFVKNYDSIKKKVKFDNKSTYTFEFHNKNRKLLADTIKDLEYQIKKVNKSAKKVDEIVVLQLELQKSNNKMKDYDALFDTLRLKAEKEIDAPANFTHWFPSSNRHWKYIFYNKFYGKTMQKDLFVGNNASLQINDSGTTVQSELVSSFFGPFRVSFGTILANKTSDSSSDTTTNRESQATDAETDSASSNTLTEGLQLLQSGGGNVYLNIDYPLFGTQTKFATFYANLYGRASGLFSQMTNSIDTSTGNGCAGLSLYGSVASDDRILVGFLNFNFAGYAGGSEYYRTLNLTQNKVFAFGQLNIGIDFKNAFRLTYTPFTLGSDESLRKISGTIGFQISSEMFKS